MPFTLLDINMLYLWLRMLYETHVIGCVRHERTSILMGPANWTETVLFCVTFIYLHVSKDRRFSPLNTDLPPSFLVVIFKTLLSVASKF
jgi:hypothetical protein